MLEITATNHEFYLAPVGTYPMPVSLTQTVMVLSRSDSVGLMVVAGIVTACGDVRVNILHA